MEEIMILFHPNLYHLSILQFDFLELRKVKATIYSITPFSFSLSPFNNSNKIIVEKKSEEKAPRYICITESILAISDFVITTT